MKQKDFEPYKRMLRFLVAIVMIAVATIIFTCVWIENYNKGVVFPFYYKGHWMMAAFYAVLLGIFMFTYGGMKFGYLKHGNIMFSQMLAVICANALAYFLIVLLSAKFVNIVAIILMTVADFIFIIVWVTLTDLLFKKMFPPRKILLLYEDYTAEDLMHKMLSRKDRYEIAEMMDVSEGWEAIIGKIEKYDAVLIYDVHSLLRNRILKYCYERSIRVYMTPKISDIIIRSSESIHLFDTPLLLSRNTGLTFEQKFVKRMMDVVISAVALVVASPFMLLTAIAIKLYDGGPVLFKQARCTIDSKVFYIHKFRSMIVDAEKDGISVPASEKDPRITPIGDFIRKTRLDELPQLFDILVGNMSIVGPRPERIEHVEKYTDDIPEFVYRLKVKGGLTGYAQIYGKYNTTAYDKLKLDLMYIQNYSVLMDIRLILMTIKVMFMKESTEGFDEKRIGEIQAHKEK